MEKSRRSWCHKGLVLLGNNADLKGRCKGEALGRFKMWALRTEMISYQHSCCVLDEEFCYVMSIPFLSIEAAKGYIPLHVTWDRGWLESKFVKVYS